MILVITDTKMIQCTPFMIQYKCNDTNTNTNMSWQKDTVQM